jgi:hypothetical protein
VVRSGPAHRTHDEIVQGREWGVHHGLNRLANYLAHRTPGDIASVLGGEEKRSETLERSHQLIELARLKALIGLRSEVVGERLDR